MSVAAALQRTYEGGSIFNNSVALISLNFLCDVCDIDSEIIK